MAGIKRGKFFHGTRQRVVNAKAHENYAAVPGIGRKPPMLGQGKESFISRTPRAGKGHSAYVQKRAIKTESTQFRGP
jgi:hypothetical protein